jgi:hypothetical protein
MEVDRDRLKAPGVPSRLEVTDEFLLFQWRTWAPVSTTALVQGVVCDPRRSLEPGWRRRAEALEAYWEQLATWIDQDHPQRTRVSNCSINRACRLPT